jgi:glycine/D-amino acid oxidase-like deaminating enzyme
MRPNGVSRDAFASDRLRDAQIVVIGAGAVGAALTYRLAQAGARVTVVERRFPGAGTSGSSFAWLNGYNKQPREYYRLNMRSIRDHEDLADELGGDWVHVHGGLHWAHAGGAEEDRLRQVVDRLRRWGSRVDTTTPEVVMRELEPDVWIDQDRVSEVFVVAREGYLDPVAMAHGAVYAAIRRYGARRERAEVTGVRTIGDAVSAVVLDDCRELPADVIVNAAGPEAARVAALAGVQMPLDRQVGLVVTTEPASVSIKRLVYSPEMHVRPCGAGRLLLHDEEMDAHAEEGRLVALDAPVVQRAMDKTRRLFPGLADARAEATRVGVRPVPKDGYPIVGFEPALSGLYTVVTHSGITLAARLALLVTEELTSGDTDELGAWRPTRFTETLAAPLLPVGGRE